MYEAMLKICTIGCLRKNGASTECGVSGGELISPFCEVHPLFSGSQPESEGFGIVGMP